MLKHFICFVAVFAIGLCAPPPTIPAKEKGSAELNRIVSNSPRLDLFLNLPQKCDRAYDALIHMLERCKSGEDNGHPSLEYGCFLHINFEAPEFKCNTDDINEKYVRPQNSAIYFPAVTETPWHPTPKCESPDCEDVKPIWSGDKDIGDAFGGDFGPDVSREEIIDYLLELLNREKSKQN